MSWQDYEVIATPIASEFARRYRRFGAEVDDLLQEMRIWLATHPQKIADWTDEDPESVDKRVARSLRNEAKDYCEKIKAQSLGYHTDDLSWYSRNELKSILDVLFDQEAWTSPPVPEDGGRRVGDPATGGNYLAMLADVAQGFDKLPTDDRELLLKLHRDGSTTVDIAKGAGVSQQSVSASRHRALKRLLDILGGDRPGHDRSRCECSEYVGTRRAMSNAAARAAIENQYQED